jgi:hypothetical protein
MELVQEGMQVFPNDGLPELPVVLLFAALEPIEELQIPVLIVGGGPAGLSAPLSWETWHTMLF